MKKVFAVLVLLITLVSSAFTTDFYFVVEQTTDEGIVSYYWDTDATKKYNYSNKMFDLESKGFITNENLFVSYYDYFPLPEILSLGKRCGYYSFIKEVRQENQETVYYKYFLCKDKYIIIKYKESDKKYLK